MNKAYIKFFYDEDNNLVAEIHKDGKYRKVRGKNMNKLTEICEKYGYEINRNGKLEEDAIEISEEYEKYLDSKKNLKVYGNIDKNMKLSRKDNSKKKIIAGATIIAAIGIGAFIGFHIIDDIRKDENKPYVGKEITQEDEEIITTSEPTTEITTEINTEEDIIVAQPTTEEKKEKLTEELSDFSSELSDMFKESEFHFICSTPIYYECLEKAKRYDDIFEKYGNQYGIDKNYLEAKAAQETGGDHYNNLGNTAAWGIMQIEKSANIGRVIKAYNFETDQIDEVTITYEGLQDLDSNIKIGAMIAQNCFEKWNYNIPLAIQEYNMGEGNIEKMLSTCSSLENIEREELTRNTTNPAWLDYRAFLNSGDPEYIEHVFRYLDNGYTLKFRRVDNKEYECLTIYNDYQKEKNY